MLCTTILYILCVPQTAYIASTDLEFAQNTQSGSQWDGLRHYGLLEHRIFYNKCVSPGLPFSWEIIDIKFIALQPISSGQELLSATTPTRWIGTFSSMEFTVRKYLSLRCLSPPFPHSTCRLGTAWHLRTWRSLGPCAIFYRFRQSAALRPLDDARNLGLRIRGLCEEAGRDIQAG